MQLQNTTVLILFAVFTMTAIGAVSCDNRSYRTKRKVIFVRGSKFFIQKSKNVEHKLNELIEGSNYNNFRIGTHGLVRLNFKANTLPYTSLFAYAAGYKLNFDLPTEAKAKPLRFHRRDILENIETIFNENGLHGRECMLRFLCEAATYVLPTSGLFQRLIKLIFTIPESQRNLLHPYSPQTNCQSMSDICPLSLFHILALEVAEDT